MERRTFISQYYRQIYIGIYVVCIYNEGIQQAGENTSAAPSFRILCCLFSSSGSNIIAPTPRHNPGHGQQQISSSVIYKLYSYRYYTHVYARWVHAVCVGLYALYTRLQSVIFIYLL